MDVDPAFKGQHDAVVVGAVIGHVDDRIVGGELFDDHVRAVFLKKLPDGIQVFTDVEGDADQMLAVQILKTDALFLGEGMVLRDGDVVAVAADGDDLYLVFLLIIVGVGAQDAVEIVIEELVEIYGVVVGDDD